MSYRLGAYESDVTIEIFEECGYIRYKDLDQFFDDCYFDFETKLTREKFIKISKDNLMKHPKYKEFINNEVKMCYDCQMVKPLSSYWDDAYKNGKRPYCAKCCDEKNREWKENNKDKVSKHNATYYQKHKDKVREQQRKWAKKNKARNNQIWKRYNLKKTLKAAGYDEDLLTREKLDLIIQLKTENKITTYKEVISRFGVL